jgi:hypothetical protein
MEYCDGGTLRHALKRGIFHRRLPSGEVGVDLCALLEVRGGPSWWQRSNGPEGPCMTLA